eukprot:COSAG06_NODE_22379_length_724_cov_1.311502_1_plen_75_part_01
MAFPIGSIIGTYLFSFYLHDATMEGMDATRGFVAASVRKRVFLRRFYIKTIILPRQARDKHKKNSKKDAFPQGFM